MSRKSIRVRYNGETHEIKVTLNSLRLAEEYSGISITKAFASEIPIGFIQGLIYGELKERGLLGEMSYDDFGKTFDDTSQIGNMILDFWQAIAPDDVFTEESNDDPKQQNKPGRGNKSNG